MHYMNHGSNHILELFAFDKSSNVKVQTETQLKFKLSILFREHFSKVIIIVTRVSSSDVFFERMKKRREALFPSIPDNICDTMT